MKKLTKKQIMNYYKENTKNITCAFLCFFINKVDSNLYGKFETYLDSEKFFINSNNFCGEYMDEDMVRSTWEGDRETMEIASDCLRVMVLEDFLTKQGIK